MMSQGLSPLPSTVLEYAGEQIQNSGFRNSPTTQPTASSSALKRKRNLPGTPDPNSEVVALSPNSLMATNKFLCEVCNKGFQRDQNLQLHRRGHNLPWKLKQRSNKEIVKKKVYICPEKSCVHHDQSRALGDLTGIKKHFSRKHGEKKWKCDKCPKKYAVKSDWKAHSKLCGTKEHKCDCGTLFSRKDSFMTHRAFCTAVVNQSGSRFAPSITGINNPLSLRNDFMSGYLGNPQIINETHQFSGGSGGFYPELLPNNFNHYGLANNGESSNHHQLNPYPRFLMGNPTTNLSNDLLLQSAFGNANMSSLDQMIGNTSDGRVMQVKREDEILGKDLVENMTSLYNNPTTMLNNQSSTDQFLGSVVGRNNNNNVGLMNYGVSNGEVYFMGNNGFAESAFTNSLFSRPHPGNKDHYNNAESLNHLFLSHDSAEMTSVNGDHETKNDVKQREESSQTRDFLGVGGNELTREQFQLAASSIEQFNPSISAAADLDMPHTNQQWKH